MDINNLLLDYRNVTLELIDVNDDIEKVESLIEKRQQIINNINSSSFEKNKFKEIAENLNLLELEDKLIYKIKKESADVRKALDNLKKLKKARSLYNQGENNAVFFNMKSY